MRPLRLLALVMLGSLIGLVAPAPKVAGQATPIAPAGESPQITALLVTAINDPQRVTGSDGMVHIEYDLVITSNVEQATNISNNP